MVNKSVTENSFNKIRYQLF